MKTSFRPSSGQAWPWVAATAILGLAFSLSCLLLPVAADLSTPSGRTVADAFAGESRAALGDQFFQTADLYFHRGIEHATVQAFSNDVFQALGGEISPQAHVHLHGRGVGEIMPWLWLSVRANPRNVEASLVAAFWLAGDAGRQDLALNALREARIANPGNHRIPLEEGRIYLAQNRLADAKRAFDAGLALWPGGEPPDGEDARLDKRNLLLHRALILENNGDTAGAIADIREILRLFPEMPGLRRRLADLEKGVAPAQQPLIVLKNVLEVQNQQRAQCPEERAEGGPAHDDKENPVR